ncbi:MAG: class I SAM-dependent methyltransferase [Acidimicrobiales bacterium]|nr:class I SAM-dependent methyltransferase [Acidimicrobiales bacterium]
MSTTLEPEPHGPIPHYPGVFTTLHDVLHEGRSLALADMPPGASTLLSAGANGRWYFDWVDREYGRVAQHIGVEAYLPKPDDLPSNVTWIEADLAGPDGVATVASDSVDLVFSGQNIEHLWPEQMVAFLIETNRVLRHGGCVVIDSPNRNLTKDYRWSMSEHTVELSPGEATDLLGLAGFAAESMRGVWLCREGGALLPLEPTVEGDGPARTLRRLVLARNRPEDSFIWWAEARKVGRPDRDALIRRIDEIFRGAWDERVNRIRPHDGDPFELADGRPGARLPRGREGYVALGPSLPLPPGTYRIGMDVTWSGLAAPGETIGRLEVVADSDLLSVVDLRSQESQGSSHVSLDLTLEELRFAVHARLFSTGRADVVTPLELHISPAPWLRSNTPASSPDGEPWAAAEP